MPISGAVNYNELPPWLSAWSRDVAERARAASYEPYKPYTGQRFANTAPEINRARELSNEYTRVYEPYLRHATDLSTEAARDFPSQAGFYMNPYQTHVVDNIAHYGNRNFNENVLPKVNDTFTRAGAFGGGRHRDMVARMTRDTQEGIRREQQQALAGGYNQAIGAFNQDRNRMLDASKQKAAIGGLYQAQNAADVNALMQQGQYQQQQDQNKLDYSYQNFLDQREYPYQQIGRFANVLNGVPQQSTQSTTFTQIPSNPQVNTWGQIGALATNLYGLNMLGGR